jgi:hypothetical protein
MSQLALVGSLKSNKTPTIDYGLVSRCARNIILLAQVELSLKVSCLVEFYPTHYGVSLYWRLVYSRFGINYQ